MGAKCRLGILIVTFNEETRLVGAVRSVLHTRGEVAKIYLIDDGSDKPKAMEQLEQARRIILSAGVPLVFMRLSHMGAGPARKMAYDRVLEEGGIHMLTSLDSDDMYGSGMLAAMRQTYERHDGNLDLIVPRHIIEVRDSDRKRQTLTLTIPKVPTDLMNPSEELVGAWVQLTKVGATFGANLDAIRRFGSFETGDHFDEWVVAYTKWAGLKAACVYADVRPRESYRYTLHDGPQHNSYRRELHQQRQHEAARRGFRAAAERLQLLSTSQPRALLA